MGMKQQNIKMMLAMMMAASNSANGFDEDIVKKEKKEIKIIRHKNHKEFFYGENSVWALNKIVADKKARKKGYL